MRDFPGLAKKLLVRVSLKNAEHNVRKPIIKNINIIFSFFKILKSFLKSDLMSHKRIIKDNIMFPEAIDRGKVKANAIIK